MNVSTRFTVALHILTLLASTPGEPLTSEFIAGSVNTNPVVIRRLLALLRNTGFVQSRPGASGGWEISRDPAKINLADIRRAVNEGSAFAMHNNPPNPACPVGRNIQGALEGIYTSAERAMEADLARTTIKDLLLQVSARRKA
jgi:Rrf2 family protein